MLITSVRVVRTEERGARGVTDAETRPKPSGGKAWPDCEMVDMHTPKYTSQAVAWRLTAASSR